jgi:hypothetical protein
LGRADIAGGVVRHGGVMKVTGDVAMLEKMMPSFSLVLIRIVGVAETVAALGLVLPAATRFWPALSAGAAVGLAVEAVLFVAYHLSVGAYVPAVATF